MQLLLLRIQLFFKRIQLPHTYARVSFLGTSLHHAYSIFSTFRLSTAETDFECTYNAVSFYLFNPPVKRLVIARH